MKLKLGDWVVTKGHPFPSYDDKVLRPLTIEESREDKLSDIGI